MLEKIEEVEKENGNEIKNNKKKILIISFIIILAILIICIAVVSIFSIKQINDTKIKKGVHVAGIDVSGLSKEEAISTLERFYTTNPDDYIYLRYKNYDYCVSIEQIAAEFDIKSAIEEAYKYRKRR